MELIKTKTVKINGVIYNMYVYKSRLIYTIKFANEQENAIFGLINSNWIKLYEIQNQYDYGFISYLRNFASLYCC